MADNDAKIIELAKAFDSEIDALEMKYNMLIVASGTNPISASQITLVALYSNFLRGKKAHETTVDLLLPEEIKNKIACTLDNALAEISEAVGRDSKARINELHEKFGPLIKAMRDVQ